MKKLFLLFHIFFIIFCVPFSYAKSLDNKLGNSLDGSNSLFHVLERYQYFSALFKQSTFQENNQREILGSIKADRSGKFKISYFEPLNEIMMSDGKDFFRFDPELEQLVIEPLEGLLKETPVGLFTLNNDELKNLFLIRECKGSINIFSCLLISKNEESFIKSINIKIKNSTIDSLKYIDTFGQIISLKFNDVSMMKIPDNEFQLNIPEGIDIVKYQGNK
tara:strand:- start:16034 stop:16693 length:660 start_codon:yes stop_codon:yes gene_type:complete